MKMRGRVIAYLIYGMLIGASALNIAEALWGPDGRRTHFAQVRVMGNVARPGWYRVPEGTTRFELLRVAGVNPTSNVLPIDLNALAQAGDELIVGTLDTPVALRDDSARMRLEFFFGEITVLDREGRSRALYEGMSLETGDRLLTEARSQAELSVNTFSHVDVDDFTEIVVDRLGLDEQNRRIVELYQNTGGCWYSIVYPDRAELFRTRTPLALLTVGGTGADLMVDAKPEQTVVHCLEGLVTLERYGTDEAFTLIGGQSVLVFADGRPLQVQTVRIDVAPRSRFAQLAKLKSDRTLRLVPFQVVLYGIPNSYFFVSLRYDQGIARTVNLPAGTSVQQFVQGAGTLSHALLQLGPVITTSVIERILDTRVTKYYMVSRDDIIRLAGMVGGLTVEVDAAAAAVLKIQSGRRKLDGEQIAKFVAPSISGWQDAQRRQNDVLRAVFEGIHSKSIVVTSLLATRLVSDVESNITAADIMAEMEKFLQRRGWKLHQYTLPGQEVSREGQTVFEVDLEKARAILHSK